ncbi:MAG: hypothetical protein IJW84_00585 [Alphaproteobacteria bacterium]|nr:hypothetical protein [Alphaproteobacteria bacterium]
MIQNGDKFTLLDLRDSVRQVLGNDMREHIHNIKQTPDLYAKRQISQYADIKSSAINLDKQLRDAGFKTTHKFSYDYNISWLLYKDIINEAYRLEYFYNLATNPRLNIKFGHRDAVHHIFDDAARVSYYYAQYIWALNPSARFDYATRFHMYRDWGLILNFLLGVGFQFHPRDINEFITHHNAPDLSRAEYDKMYTEQLVFKNWCANKYNIDTGCLVLCPEHRTKLSKILTRTDTPYVIQLLRRLIPSCGR